MIKSVAVFCGSKAGNNPIYIQHAFELGKLIAYNNIELIYGGGKAGLMGAIADTVLENAGRVQGIIPELLVEKEHQHPFVKNLHVVKDMHTRKRMMYEKSDMAIILAGGYGTMDELFEMITWNNLKIHEKRIVILNSNGYYNTLLQLFEKFQSEDFLYERWTNRIEVYNQPSEISFTTSHSPNQH